MKIIMGIALAVTAIALAPTAPAEPADVQDFISAVQADGMRGTPSVILSDGLAVCEAFGKGLNGLQVAKMLAQDENLTLTHAEQFVVDAAHYLCPQYEPHGHST